MCGGARALPEHNTVPGRSVRREPPRYYVITLCAGGSHCLRTAASTAVGGACSSPQWPWCVLRAGRVCVERGARSRTTREGHHDCCRRGVTRAPHCHRHRAIAAMVVGGRAFTGSSRTWPDTAFPTTSRASSWSDVAGRAVTRCGGVCCHDSSWRAASASVSGDPPSLSSAPPSSS